MRKIDLDSVKSQKKEKKRNKSETDGTTVSIPASFMKIAQKFGLPKEHLDFFYSNRSAFQWESKDNTQIHCSETSCKFTMKVSRGCLIDHMVSFHNYADIPCGKP